MGDMDREMGEIVAKLEGLEHRLAAHEVDMRALNNTVSELIKSVAALTTRITMTFPIAQTSNANPANASSISVAAGAGGLAGAGVAKLLAYFGIS